MKFLSANFILLGANWLTRKTDGLHNEETISALFSPSGELTRFLQDHDCHCDGPGVIHCADEADEAHCTCDANSVITCHEHDESDHGDCHCDGPGVIHCVDEADELVCSCDVSAELVCADDLGCHCDGSVVHCSSAEDEAYCSCDAGDRYTGRSLQCDFSERPSDTSASGDKPWGEALVSALIVNLITLIGVFIIAGEYLRKLICPGLKASRESVITWKRNIIPMFACGVLLATTFFLIIPEALHMIEASFGDPHAGHNHRMLREENPEAAATWRWGTAIIGGILIPIVTHFFFPHVDDSVEIADKIREEARESRNNGLDNTMGMTTEHIISSDRMNSDEERFKEESTKSTKKQDSTAETEEEGLPPTSSSPTRFAHLRNKGMIVSLFVGDFFHNFADGVFIGTAWLSCSRDLAITVTAATILHELPQEVADYLLMVDECGMKPWEALLLNFVCGLSIMIGAIIVLAANLTNYAIGIILCVSGGVYIHIAIAECLPVAEKVQHTWLQKLWSILAFICGAVPIGLILMNHQHCGGH